MTARRHTTRGSKPLTGTAPAAANAAGEEIDMGALSLLSWRDYDSDGRDAAAASPRKKMTRAKITPKKVTLRMIAEAVGLSHVSVSLALRNHASIPEQTRLRVRETAEQMGYQPDPMLSALNAYRRTRQAVRYQATLILVNPYKERSALDRSINFSRYRIGAAERAQELGFALEEFWLAQPGMTAQRFHQILKARQVQGVLLLPAPYSYVFPDVQWSNVSVVQFGFSQAQLFHLVTNAQLRSIRLCVNRLYELGYRRIGMVSYRIPQEFKAGLWSATDELGLKLNMLQMPNDEFNADSCALLGGWVRKQRLDAVIGFDGLCQALERASVRVPADVAVALLNASEGQDIQAGIDQCSHEIGRVAVDQLARMIQNNERGFPAHPLRILVDGVWVDGDSAPAKAATSTMAVTDSAVNKKAVKPHIVNNSATTHAVAKGAVTKKAATTSAVVNNAAKKKTASKKTVETKADANAGLSKTAAKTAVIKKGRATHNRIAS